MPLKRPNQIWLALLALSMLLNVVLIVKLYQAPAIETAASVPQTIQPMEAGNVSGPGANGKESQADAAGGGEKKFDLERFLAAHKKGATGEELLADFLAWVRASPADALAWAESETEGKMRLLLLDAGLTEWAAKNPMEAAVWVREMGTDFNQEIGFTAVFDSWARTDPGSASAYFKTLPAAMKKIVAETFARRWAQDQPAEATKWALEYDNTEGDGSSFMASFAIWAESDLEDARAFASSLASNKHEIIAHQLLAVQWATKEPQAAAEWANSLPDPAIRIHAIGATLDEWAQNAPSKAAAFVKTLTDVPTAQRAATVLAHHWGGSDITAAESWVRTLPQGPLRDSAVEGLVGSQFGSNPRRALEWSATFGDPLMREQITVEIYENWKEIAPDEATRWLQDSNTNSIFREIMQPPKAPTE